MLSVEDGLGENISAAIGLVPSIALITGLPNLRCYSMVARALLCMHACATAAYSFIIVSFQLYAAASLHSLLFHINLNINNMNNI